MSSNAGPGELWCRGTSADEPIWPHQVKPGAFAALETLAAAGGWDQFAFAFFANTLHVPGEELDAVRISELCPPIVADAPRRSETFVRWSRTGSIHLVSRASTFQ